MTNVTFRVPDMNCGHCKATVEGELNRLSGAEYSNADLEKGVVEVRYDEDRATAGQLEGAIEDAGYTVTA